MKQKTVKIADIKKYLKNGGKRADITNFMGYASDTVVSKWISRGSVPRWQQGRLKEFFDAVKN